MRTVPRCRWSGHDLETDLDRGAPLDPAPARKSRREQRWQRRRRRRFHEELLGCDPRAADRRSAATGPSARPSAPGHRRRSRSSRACSSRANHTQPGPSARAPSEHGHRRHKDIERPAARARHARRIARDRCGLDPRRARRGSPPACSLQNVVRRHLARMRTQRHARPSAAGCGSAGGTRPGRRRAR